MPIGFDAGTYNLVCCKRNEKQEFVNTREVNAFIEMPIDAENRFMYNMMRKAGVPLIERKEAGVVYAIGEKAVNIAYTLGNIELRRPMKDGCLNPKEKSAQQIMSIVIHSLVEKARKNEILFYCVPSNAINEQTNAEYHQKILQAMFDAFTDDAGNKVTAYPINEALALIYAELESKNWTGIGISFGAGMVNLCYANVGTPIFQFAIVNSGDWIDKMAAVATGESIAFINKEKTKVDLTANSESLVQRAIKAQYEIMMQKTISEIKRGLIEKNAKSATPVDFVIAGGTSMPKGFDTVFTDMLKKAKLPIEIGTVKRPDDPLYAVARGCLRAAEEAI